MTRRANEADISAIAAINRLSFSGNKPPGLAEEWIASHYRQGNQYQYFVFVSEGRVAGYISWEIRGGFAREIPVIELEQLAVHPDQRGRGIGGRLVEETFAVMRAWVKGRQPEATKLRVLVWTRKDNEKAQALYTKICPTPLSYRNIYGGSDEVMLFGEHSL